MALCGLASCAVRDSVLLLTRRQGGFDRRTSASSDSRANRFCTKKQNLTTDEHGWHGFTNLKVDKNRGFRSHLKPQERSQSSQGWERAGRSSPCRRLTSC